MVVCRRCGGYCDNGEIIGGVCMECIEEENIIRDRETDMTLLLSSPSYQMELKLEEINYG